MRRKANGEEERGERERESEGAAAYCRSIKHLIFIRYETGERRGTKGGRQDNRQTRIYIIGSQCWPVRYLDILINRLAINYDNQGGPGPRCRVSRCFAPPRSTDPRTSLTCARRGERFVSSRLVSSRRSAIRNVSEIPTRRSLSRHRHMANAERGKRKRKRKRGIVRSDFAIVFACSNVASRLIPLIFGFV